MKKLKLKEVTLLKVTQITTKTFKKQEFTSISFLQFTVMLPTLCVTRRFSWYKSHQSTACMLGFPGGTDGKELTSQCRRHQRCEFETWVRKIPWRRAWQPTPVFLPGESHGQRSLAGYRPQGHKESVIAEKTQHASMQKRPQNLNIFKKSYNLLLKFYLFESEVTHITLISLLSHLISYQMISKAILTLNLTLCRHRAQAHCGVSSPPLISWLIRASVYEPKEKISHWSKPVVVTLFDLTSSQSGRSHVTQFWPVRWKITWLNFQKTNTFEGKYIQI